MSLREKFTTQAQMRVALADAVTNRRLRMIQEIEAFADQYDADQGAISMIDLTMLKTRQIEHLARAIQNAETRIAFLSV